MHFIGRTAELERLGRFRDGSDSAIAVVYGRRRVGKSFLIRQALYGSDAFFFEALEDRPTRDQIRHFLFQLNEQLGQDKPKTARSWKEALLLLAKAIQNKPRVVVFDEFQWMANYRHELISDLKYVWDQFFSATAGQKLILCGSIASFMVNKIINSKALYGRIDVHIRLSGFKLKETAAMLPDKGLDEVMEAQMLTGGIPKYLQLLGAYPSIRLGMEELAFTPGGYFTVEYGRIFTSHFGKNPAFAAIISVLARHPLGLFREPLGQEAKLPAGGQLSSYLEDLESADFIRSVTPFDKPSDSRLIKYFLSDAYLRFYFSFIRPALGEIAAEQRSNTFVTLAQSSAYHAWIGRSFEYLCIQHANQISRLLGFGSIDYTMGPYFVSPKKEQAGCQIDLLFDRADNVITVCEMKYSQHPVGVEVIAEMEKKLQFIEPAAARKTFHRVLIARDKPTRELLDRGYFYRIIEARELLGQ